MRIYRSAWVVPVASYPIPRGAVAIEGGEIAGVGPADEVLRGFGDKTAAAPRDDAGPREVSVPGDRGSDRDAAGRSGGRATSGRSGDRELDGSGTNGIVDLGASVVMPALVNAHTHLELSWMKREPPPKGDLLAWVRAMIGRRVPPEAEVDLAIGDAIAEMRAGGIALVGDVGNSTVSLGPLRRAGLGGCFFLELTGAAGFAPAQRCDDAEHRLAEVARQQENERRSHDTGHGFTPASMTAAVVPHSPTIVEPELMREIAARARRSGAILSMHLSESRADADFLERGVGPFRILMEQLGRIGPDWTPPGLSPAHLADREGLLGPRTLAAHGVHLDAEGARLLAARGTTVVLCPRSNAWIGVGEAPVAMFHREGVRIAVGADSYASNESLDLLAELAALRRLAPGVPPGWLVSAATLGGAAALGQGSHYGTIEPGKRSALVALTRLPAAGDAGCDQELADASEPGAKSPAGAACEAEPWATIFAGPSRVAVTPLP